MLAHHRHHGRLERFLILDEIRFGHHGLKPTGLGVFHRNGIAEGQYHHLQLWLQLPCLARQLKAVAALQKIGADQ